MSQSIDAGHDVTERPKGIAPIKKEFLVLNKGQIINWDFVLDQDQTATETSEKPEEGGEKRPRMDDRDLHPEKRFKLRGQNKNKFRYKMGRSNYWSKGRKDENDGDRHNDERRPVVKSERVCLRYLEQEGRCHFSDKCDYSHDLYKIYKINENLRFDQEKPCYIYSTYGRCQYGVACLFSSNHTKILEKEEKVFNLINHRRWSLGGGKANFNHRYTNRMDTFLQQRLRRKTYNFKVVTEAMNTLYKADLELSGGRKDEDKEDEDATATQDDTRKPIGAVLVDEYLKGRDFERKKVDFKEKLMLSPLTTVGNLPFRRLCKKFSCDVTCAEMSLGSSLLNGNPSEWSHIKRHESEDIFGVQITATHPEVATKVVKVLSDEFDLDFVDFNCGCPTDFIYQSGAGAGLMSRPSKLRKMIAGASMVSKVPVTVKMRAGIQEDKNTAHNLIKSIVKPFSSKYIGAITIHGRSRAQRYSRLADWDYIDKCGEEAGDIPVIGSGDCISWQGYYENMDKYKNISGIMIARGALLAPWLFTEIKEKRTWDISGKERLEIIGDFAKFALDHWGSDATGIENSRRYLLEWLSFACRYIPVGLLEVLPQKVNERPPLFKGRDELETLLSSPAASDWVKISEMFLGKVPDGFKFLPKHKANAYESVVEG